MSAPAALVCSKLLFPETEVSKLSNEEIRLESGIGETSNLLDAATRGATDGATLVLHITAIVIAFIASVAFLNALVSFFGGLEPILQNVLFSMDIFRPLFLYFCPFQSIFKQ